MMIMMEYLTSMKKVNNYRILTTKPLGSVVQRPSNKLVPQIPN